MAANSNQLECYQRLKACYYPFYFWALGRFKEEYNPEEINQLLQAFVCWCYFCRETDSTKEYKIEYFQKQFIKFMQLSNRQRIRSAS